MKANEVIRDFYKEVGYPDIEEENPLDEIFHKKAEEYFREEEEPEVNFEREDRIAERAFCKSRGIRF